MDFDIEYYQKLIEENHNLIYTFMIKYHYSEDYYGDAAIGLCKAARLYDESKGAFSTIAFACMRNECLKAIKDHNRIDAVSYNNIIPDFEDDDNTYEHLLADDKHTSNDVDNCEYLKWFVGKMDKTSLFVFLHRLQGETYSDIGKILGISRERVRQIAKKIKISYEEKRRIIKRNFDTDECNDLRNQIVDCFMSLCT